jgi:hypothetical protein
VGAWPDLAAAIRGMTRPSRRLVPNPTTRAIYDATYAAYRRLHPAIAPIVRDLAAATAATAATAAAAGSAAAATAAAATTAEAGR